MRELLKARTPIQHVALICICSLSLSLLAAFSSIAAPTYTLQNKPENLQAYFELIYQTLYDDKNPDKAAVLFSSLIPDKARLKKALKDEVQPELIPKLLDLYQRLGLPNKGNIHELIQANKSVVAVYAATTEELAANVEGSPAWEHFAGGARGAAPLVLRPQMTFYQVKLTAPGQPHGMTFHLFYWDGRQWSMLGKVWQVLR
jgi:hypothetical protein